ncbi:MAG TPA: glycosyltransferase [Gemmatimonadaceae bacterium]|nr:glycosyltransferase [Gemmatimonadaceae bacterium]
MTQNDSPRVLHVVTALGLGGVEVWLLALLERNRELEKRGLPTETIDILLTGGERSVLDDKAISLGATLHYIPFGKRTFVRFARDFRKLLRKRDFTVIHDHQDYAGAWRFLAGAGMLPSLRIIHVHNPPVCLRINTHSPRQRALFRVARAIVRHSATHVLGTSAQVLREYGFNAMDFPRQIIKAVHCGFDVRPFAQSHEEANASVCDELGWPRGSRIALFVGRLEGFDPHNPEWNHKNPAFALEVVRGAIESGTDVRLAVVGEGGKMRATLESSVAAAGLKDRIRFLGKRFDIPRLMSAAHVCLFPSLEEGLGMVAVEAQAAGLRVLISDTVPREAEVVRELTTFVSLDSGVEAWAAELARQIALPRHPADSAAAEVGRSSFEIAESYRQLHDIYSSVSPPSRKL